MCCKDQRVSEQEPEETTNSLPGTVDMMRRLQLYLVGPTIMKFALHADDCTFSGRAMIDVDVRLQNLSFITERSPSRHSYRNSRHMNCLQTACASNATCNLCNKRSLHRPYQTTYIYQHAHSKAPVACPDTVLWVFGAAHLQALLAGVHHHVLDAISAGDLLHPDLRAVVSSGRAAGLACHAVHHAHLQPVWQETHTHRIRGCPGRGTGVHNHNTGLHCIDIVLCGVLTNLAAWKRHIPRGGRTLLGPCMSRCRIWGESSVSRTHNRCPITEGRTGHRDLSLQSR